MEASRKPPSPLLLAVLSVLLFVGCAPSPLKRFSLLGDTNQPPPRITLITDLLIVRDAGGMRDAIDTPYNLDMAGKMSARLTDKLTAAGYVVAGSTVAGLGLNLRMASMTFIVDGAEQRTEIVPPAYVSNLFLDPLKKEALLDTITALEGFDYRIKKSTPPVAQRIADIAPEGADAVAVLIGRRRNVSFAKQFFLGVLTGAAAGVGYAAAGGAPGGFVPIVYGPIPPNVVSLYIVDAKSGELIWADYYAPGAGIPSTTESELLGCVDWVAKRVPKRN